MIQHNKSLSGLMNKVLMNIAETMTLGVFSHADYDEKVYVFEDMQGNPFEVEIRHIEQIINLQVVDKPSFYYRTPKLY